MRTMMSIAAAGADAAAADAVVVSAEARAGSM